MGWCVDNVSKLLGIVENEIGNLNSHLPLVVIRIINQYDDPQITHSRGFVQRQRSKPLLK